MHFKHPEILYFLFLLVIPILVHLFQLRRFKKTYFTNVKLLKELQQQTHKTSTIKKWLLLATRLLLLTFLILAFAQPFFEAKESQQKQNELVILLDNSFSMQAKGENGELFKKAVQDILESIDENQIFSIVTPSVAFWDVDKHAIQSDLQKLSYTYLPFEIDNLVNQVQLSKPNIPVDYIVVTDGVEVKPSRLLNNTKSSVYFWLPKSEKQYNCNVESMSIVNVSDNLYDIKIDLKAFGTLQDKVQLSIFEDEQVIAKTQVDFEDNKAEVIVSIPKKDMQGTVVIDDKSLIFDNTYYFTLAKPEKSNVLVVSNEANTSFLSKIYTDKEFNLEVSTLKELDFSKIENQDCIVLNELKNLPQSLLNTLQVFYQNRGNIVVVPNIESNIDDYNNMFQKFGNGKIVSSFNTEKEITKINFKHPLYENVFEKTVSNFQYPKVNSGFQLSGNFFNILTFSDGQSFLASLSNKVGTLYLFSSALNKANSNFQNSPLIVPTFYKMAFSKSHTTSSTFEIGQNSNLILNTSLAKDEVVTVKNKNYSFIPIQQIITNKVKLTFQDYPEVAGNYNIIQQDKEISKISFNYPKNESNCVQNNTLNFDNFTPIKSVSEALDEMYSKRLDTVLWKWFLATTLLFLIIELLIQKFVK
ncbi:MAG: BatA domain-containing protein [Flavobacteriaceae bacterium]|nr:BatA domain-containing protein [Flavobacteriaceae bacterium]